MSRRVTSTIVVLVFAAALLATATANELRIGVGALPASPDPNFDPSLFARPYYETVFDTLVIASDGGMAPSLVESWETLNDTTWRFRVRQGVVFHNGEPFDAAALKWNFEHVLDPASQSRHLFRIQLVESVEIVDSHTVDIVTSQPFGSFLANLTYIFMLPPAHFSEVGQVEFNRAPVGTGPFRVTEWRQDEAVFLEAFAGHWRGAPRLENISFHLMPEASSRIAALEAGQVDLIFALPPEQGARLEGRGFQVVSNPIGHSFIITLKNNLGTPFDDVRVRLAANHAVNQDLIIDELLGGYANKLEGQMVGPGSVGYNPELSAYGYDPEAAVRLLNEAGYPNGFSVDIECPSGRYIKDREVCEAVAAQLNRVGIRANLQILESGVWLERWLGNSFGPMFNVAIQYAPPMDLEFASPQFTGRGSNDTFVDPDGIMAELFTQQQNTLDQAERARLLQELAQRVHDQVVYLFLFQVPNIVAASPEVQGLAFRPDYTFANVLEVSFR